MAKATPLIVSFNGGEASPKIDGRSDLDKYYTSCITLENAIPLIEGPATKAPGTYYICAAKYADKKCRLISFSFSTVQTYFIEMGEYYMRFYKDQGQIVLAYAAWLTGQSYTIGLLRTESGSYYRCLVAHTSGTFATDLSAGYWEETSGATDLAYEIPTPYPEAALYQVKFFQSADTMYLQNPSYPPKVLTRTGHTAWTLANDVCKTGVEMVITGISKANPAVVTCTTVPTTLAAGDIVYINSVVGMTEVNDIFFTAGTVVTGAGGTFQLSGIDSSAYTVYGSAGTAQGTIYGTTDNNPSCGTFIEQRRALSGTNNNPQRFNISHTSDYYDFTLDTATDSAGIQYDLVSDRVDRIYWLLGFDFLVAGTEGGIWKIGATTSTGPITQANINAKRQVAIGSKDLEPEIVSDILLWVSNLGQTIHQFTYAYEKDKWVSLDMTRIAKHITQGDTLATSGIIDMDYQKEPIPILWVVRADGQLIGMTYETQEDIYAFFRIVTNGEFESVCVTSQAAGEDVVNVSVKRTIDGSDVRYIEYFKPINFYSELGDCFFVHCGVSYDGGDAATVTAISNADPCVVTLLTGHSVTAGLKLRFTGTGTWLDTHIVTAHSVNVNDITIYNEGDSVAIDSTDTDDFPVYVYPPVATTTTYTGDPVNIIFAEQSNPCKIIAYNHGILAGTPIRIVSVGGMADLDGDYTTVTVTQDTFTIAVDSTAYDAYTTGGTVTEGETTTLSAATAEIVQKAFSSGLDHLEGETITALVDGAVHPDMEIDSGAVTLNYYGNKVHLGLPYTMTVEPMKLHAGSQHGTSRGKKQKVHKATIMFYETVGAKCGPDTDNLNIIPFGTGIAPYLTTDDKDIEFDGDWQNKSTITVVSDQPTPCTVLGIVPHLTVAE